MAKKRTYDFSRIVTDLDGKPIQDHIDLGDGKTEKMDLQLGTACGRACLAWAPGAEMSGQEKFDRYELARLVHTNGKNVEVPTEQLGKIKEYVGEAFSPLVVGAIWTLLEEDPE